MKFLDEGKPKDKYDEPFQMWKGDPSRENMGSLLKAVRPEIDRGIRAHVGKANPMVSSRARQITMKALRSYNADKGTKLGTHIVNNLQGLKRYNRTQQQIIGMPERVSLERAAVERASTELLDDLGRDASMDEIANYTGLSLKRLRYLQDFNQPMAEGFFMRQTEGGGGGNLPAVRSLAPKEDGWAELVYDDLGPVDKKIMEWTLGLHGQSTLPNAEVARRLRLSPGAISQRKAKIQQLLDQIELSPF